MERIEIGSIKKIMSHTRFLLTLRSNEGSYKSLLLFRLPSASSESSNDDIALDEIYIIESSCPHLGADMSHADLEDGEDGVVAVCPWHRYDFDLKTGKSESGLKTCVYGVEVRDGHIFAEPPEEGSGWRLVEFSPVSEDFSDAPPHRSSEDLSVSPIDLTSLPEPIVPESDPPKTLIQWAVLILNTSHPQLKIERTRHVVLLFRSGKLTAIGNEKNAPSPPDVPPREKRMVFVDPGRANKKKNKSAMLHALANIEQWAIDLAWDIIARFGPTNPTLPRQFYYNFAKIALDEAKHFSLLASRLSALSCPYGSLPIHAGLWESATETSRSLRARLAIIHLVHEARGLDVNPATIARFERMGDSESVDVLTIIHADEITHVTAAHRWFTWVCKEEGVDPVQTFREEVKAHFSGALKGPFNESDREKAGLTTEFYMDLRGQLKDGPADIKPIHVTEEAQVLVGV